MKTWIIFGLPFSLMLTILSVSSCGGQLQDPDYCEMLRKDQLSFIDDNPDSLTKEEVLQLRLEAFNENFETIKGVTIERGFPQLAEDAQHQDSCKYWAITATFIHMVQRHPSAFFTEENIDLFKREIELGNLKSNLLYPAFTIGFTSTTFCDTLKPFIETALLGWKMETDDFKQPKYKVCN